jgi:cytochrome b561
MWFHWIIAIAVIVNWRLAEAAEHLEGAERGWRMLPGGASKVQL